MLGVDPDPSAMTVRVGFGGVSDTRARGAASWQERLGGDKGPGKRLTETKREGATVNGYEFYENMRMQCA